MIHCCCAVLLFASGLGDAAARKTAPFRAVRWSDTGVEVLVQETWYELQAIEATGAEEILTFARRHYGRRWQQRFAEDLVDVFDAMERPLPRRVTLDVIALDTGESRRLGDIDMTRSNRRAVLDARRELDRAARPPERLSARQVREDVDQLLALLRTRYSYVDRHRGDWQRQLSTLPDRALAGMARHDLAVALTEILAGFGDGHTRVRGWRTALPDRTLPAALAEADGRIVALRPDRDGLIDVRHPYLVEIDGVELPTWLQAAATVVAAGSPHFVRRHSLEMLEHIQFVRERLDRPTSGSVTLTLAGSGDDDRVTRTLAIARRPWAAAPRPPAVAMRMLANRIGYLQLGDMRADDRATLERIDEIMDAFRDTAGLIIDVRGNSGGRRAILERLFPYFLGPDEAAAIVNVARYRLTPDDAVDRVDGYLANRSLYPLTATRWTADERAALQAFATAFTPQWRPNSEGFSALHFMVIRRDRRPQTYAYTQPVALLIDGACFSATDVFVGAFAGRPRVTMVGSPTDGGSGRAANHRLTHSQLDILLSTMVSYRPNGALYDGAGITPDVPVDATVLDLLGKTDTPLERALDTVRKAARP